MLVAAFSAALPGDGYTACDARSGPIRLAGGAARAQREVALPAAWNRARLELIAFVQDERSGSVLQALSA